MPPDEDPGWVKEAGRTLRFALASNPRTARLAILIIAVTTPWQHFIHF